MVIASVVTFSWILPQSYLFSGYGHGEPVQCDLRHKFVEINLHLRNDQKGGGKWKCSFSEKLVSLATEKQSGLLVKRYNLFINVSFFMPNLQLGWNHIRVEPVLKLTVTDCLSDSQM